MKNAGRHSEGDEPHEEALPRARIAGTIVAAVLVTVGLCAFVELFLRTRVGAIRPSRQFPEHALGAPRDVAGVRQDLFRIARPQPTEKERSRRELESFGWVDRERGIVRIPVEAAIDIVARRASGVEEAPAP